MPQDNCDNQRFVLSHSSLCIRMCGYIRRYVRKVKIIFARKSMNRTRTSPRAMFDRYKRLLENQQAHLAQQRHKSSK